MIFQNLRLREKAWLLAFLSCLFCYWLLVASGTCMASAPEPVYQITETELQQLETNLARLSAINSKLQLESKTQNTQVTQLQEQLRLLQNQLSILRLESEKQQALLTAANKSLEEFATEAKRERLRIKAQRNVWEAVACLAIVGCLIK